MAGRVVALRDGRVLGLSSAGDPAVERLVLFCHPTPGSGAFDPDPRVSSAWGVHMVGLDRPGYGASTPLPDQQPPSILRHADDLAEYLRGVQEQAHATARTPLNRMGVVGWGAGGRVALALAARHPGLIDRVALVATPAPGSAVPSLEPRLRAALEAAVALPTPEARARLRSFLTDGPNGLSTTPAALDVGDADSAALQRPGARDRLERMLQQAYEQGAVGHADDLLAAASDDGGMDLGAVRAKVLLLYGAKDTAVPSAHGRWYRRRLPHARLKVLPRTGHLVIVEGWQRVLEHVDPQHGDRSEA